MASASSSGLLVPISQYGGSSGPPPPPPQTPPPRAAPPPNRSPAAPPPPPPPPCSRAEQEPPAGASQDRVDHDRRRDAQPGPQRGSEERDTTHHEQPPRGGHAKSFGVLAHCSTVVGYMEAMSADGRSVMGAARVLASRLRAAWGSASPGDAPGAPRGSCASTAPAAPDASPADSRTRAPPPARH